jgi:hypothetical protein
MIPALDQAMFPSLSDKTKSFIAVSAVLAVALCNVVFGMDWVAERPAVRPLAAVTGVTEPPVTASPPVQSPPVQAAPAPPAAAGSPPLKGNTAAPAGGAPRPNAAAQTIAPAAPKIGASQPATAPKSGASQPDTAQTNAPAAPKIGASQPDTAPIMSQPDPALIIMNEPATPAAPPQCDVDACAAAYRTFTASDCTYVPSFGVRKLCTKGTPPQ